MRRWRLRNLEKVRAAGRAQQRKYRAKYPERVAEQQRRDRVLHPARTTAPKRQRLYGISPQEYETRLAAQGGVCFICRRQEVAASVHGRLRSLSVDHNHHTGKVRDLLCNTCNRVLGLADDSADRLRAMANYLDRHEMRD